MDPPRLFASEVVAEIDIAACHTHQDFVDGRLSSLLRRRSRSAGRFMWRCRRVETRCLGCVRCFKGAWGFEISIRDVEADLYTSQQSLRIRKKRARACDHFLTPGAVLLHFGALHHPIIPLKLIPRLIKRRKHRRRNHLLLRRRVLRNLINARDQPTYSTKIAPNTNPTQPKPQ